MSDTATCAPAEDPQMIFDLGLPPPPPVLTFEPPYTPAPGDQVTALPGCNDPHNCFCDADAGVGRQYVVLKESSTCPGQWLLEPYDKRKCAVILAPIYFKRTMDN